MLRWIDNRQAYRRKIGWITRIPVWISRQDKIGRASCRERVYVLV